MAWSIPSRAPIPYAQSESGRSAAIFGSSWRSVPAAALRGLANAGSPASARCSLSSRKPLRGKYTSPRTSISSGAPEIRFGIWSIVRMLWVTSSPTRPSPRVTPRASLPFS